MLLRRSGVENSSRNKRCVSGSLCACAMTEAATRPSGPLSTLANDARQDRKSSDGESVRVKLSCGWKAFRKLSFTSMLLSGHHL